MSLSVIGAGFGRTGTNSLKLALEQLGLGPCYHMLEVIRNPRHDQMWLDAAQGRAMDWDTLFQGYRSACDWPQSHFWRELAGHYPESRVILTVRDAARWYASMSRTIFQILQRDPDPDDAAAVLHRTMTRTVILDRTFHGRCQDEAYAIGIYQRHAETVRRAIPAARLLVYDVSEGWPPLCDFLGCAVPDMAFPSVNSTAEFQSRSRARHPAGDAGTR